MSAGDAGGARPTLNHVALSMDPAVLDEQGRADVLAFYGEVFGWTEGDNTGEAGNPLILYTGAFGQFVYLLPGDPQTGEFMRTPPLDHFGLQVPTLEVLRETLERARGYAARDERVRIIDVDERITHGPSHDYVLTNAYVGFLLPLMVELQHLERRDRD
jgi:hypothetical protein